MGGHLKVGIILFKRNILEHNFLFYIENIYSIILINVKIINKCMLSSSSKTKLTACIFLGLFLWTMASLNAYEDIKEYLITGAQFLGLINY